LRHDWATCDFALSAVGSNGGGPQGAAGHRGILLSSPAALSRAAPTIHVAPATPYILLRTGALAERQSVAPGAESGTGVQASACTYLHSRKGAARRTPQEDNRSPCQHTAPLRAGYGKPPQGHSWPRIPCWLQRCHEGLHHACWLVPHVFPSQAPAQLPYHHSTFHRLRIRHWPHCGSPNPQSPLEGRVRHAGPKSA